MASSTAFATRPQSSIKMGAVEIALTAAAGVFVAARLSRGGLLLAAGAGCLLWRRTHYQPTEAGKDLSATPIPQQEPAVTPAPAVAHSSEVHFPPSPEISAWDDLRRALSPVLDTPPKLPSAPVLPFAPPVPELEEGIEEELPSLSPPPLSAQAEPTLESSPARDTTANLPSLTVAVGGLLPDTIVIHEANPPASDPPQPIAPPPNLPFAMRTRMITQPVIALRPALPSNGQPSPPGRELPRAPVVTPREQKPRKTFLDWLRE